MFRKQKDDKKSSNDITSLFTQNITKLSTSNKAKVVHKLLDIIISYPEENIDKLGMIFDLLEDDNIKIVDYCVRAIGKILHDVMPTYNLYKETLQEKENNLGKGKNLSKFQRSLQNFEVKILEFYGKYISSSEVFLKSDSVSKELKLTIVKKTRKNIN